MNPPMPIIDVRDLHYSYDRGEAVAGLDLRVQPGTCHGLFGRNGAGKTTTMKCLLNLLRPQRGSVEVFGLDAATEELKVKQRLAYVPDAPAFYPWMTVRETLDYLASFRETWNDAKESELLSRFDLPAKQNVAGLSKGQRTQLALIGALCAEPQLLILDEPTSGLDPLVRREFIETVIGAYQDGDPGARTILVSTHLISEFEGLIDEFTILDRGRNVLRSNADLARQRYRRIRARFRAPSPTVDLSGALSVRTQGRDWEVIVNGDGERHFQALNAHHPETIAWEGLNLEEIFMVTTKPERSV
jgi:ABC-2 type transport system ATP-binding protein